MKTFSKNLKNLGSKSTYGVIIIAATVLCLVTFSHKVFAASGVCYDSFSSVAYNCGPTTINIRTSIPISGQTAQNGWWYYDGTQCYSLIQSTAGAVSWAGNQDCTASEFANPLSQPIPSENNQSDGALTCSSSSCDLVLNYINPIIQFLSAAVGVVVVISLVMGGIQYSTARDNPQAVAAARGRITNTLLGAVAYLLLYGFLQWLVPGGFLNG